MVNRMPDKALYERALTEFEESRDSALWLKAQAECLGDLEKARFLYIKLRAEELASEAGTVIGVDKSINTKAQIVPVERRELTPFAKRISVSVTGELAQAVEASFCAVVKAKAMSDVLCDIYVSQEVVVIAPSARDQGNLAAIGVFTGGVLGMAAGMALASLLERGQAGANASRAKDLAHLLLIDGKTAEIKAYDYRTLWDLGGGEWETRVAISGKAVFEGLQGSVSATFAFAGKTSERAFLTKPNGKVPELARLLNKPVPQIPKETKFKW